MLDNQSTLLDHYLCRAASHMILLSRSLNRLKSALLKPSAVILPFTLFSPTRIPNAIISWSLQLRMLPAFTSLLSSSMCVRRASPLTGFWITFQEVVNSEIQKPPDFLCPASLAHQRTIEAIGKPQPSGA